MRIRHKIFGAFSLLVAAHLLLAGCVWNRNTQSSMQPAKATKITESGFAAVSVTELQPSSQRADAVPPPDKPMQPVASSLPENVQSDAIPKAGSEVGEAPAAILADKEFAALAPFGRDFFHTAATAVTSAPGAAAKERKNIPVPLQYRIGPEDKINVVLKGANNAKYELTVDGKGRIDIPRLGSVFVAGMTFEEMSHEVIQKLEEAAGAKVDISMNASKTIPISVRGEVRRPGPYTIGAFATITEALLAAGGPGETGSVRNVQVRRKGMTVASFDLYDLLLKGFKSKDITLMAGDEVFVPVKGPAVGIIGSIIRRPAVYELKDRYDLKNLITLAGGIIVPTEAWWMRVERITGNERKVVYDLSEQDLKKTTVAPSLEDRDLVRISPLAARPASASTNAAVDLTVKAAGKSEIKPDTNTGRALPDKTYSSRIGEGRKPEHAANLPVQIVPVRDPSEFVTLSGEFKFPGQYPIYKGEKLSSVIKRAGGYTRNAYLRGAYFTRDSVRQMQQQNLNDMVERLQRELFPAGATGVAAKSTADKTGATPTEEELKERFIEYLKSLKATGRLTIIVANPRLLRGSSQDIEMEKGDKLYLPRSSNVVNVIGAVMSEGPHVYDYNWGYRQYVSAAGGYARFADEGNIFAIKADGSARKLSRGFSEWIDGDEPGAITAYGQEIKQIESGDVIVVPEDLTHIAWLRQIGDIDRLLMNTACLTGKVLKLW